MWTFGAATSTKSLAIGAGMVSTKQSWPSLVHGGLPAYASYSYLPSQETESQEKEVLFSVLGIELRAFTLSYILSVFCFFFSFSFVTGYKLLRLD